MNILIPYSWLKDFVKTAATPEEIAEKLSLCAFSVEKITKTTDGDTVFEIEVTPNRPDALSVLGIARELGATLPQFGIGADFSDNAQDFKITPPARPLKLEVQIKKPELCPRFAAVILKNIRVGESPAKIKERLEKVGLRPLNNVIDITNYLMIERGQPMHVFDYDKISGAQMTLRESRKGERISTLDGKERQLPEGAIIIEDEQKIIDLCGIMGGANSCVDENTKQVVLFVQSYNPARIRRTTQEMAFRTDASSRFEKGMDPEGVIPALKQAVRFLKEEAEGKIAGPIIDIKNQKYEPHNITLTLKQVAQVLGVNLAPEQITQTLKALGFEIRWTAEADEITTVPELRATPPSWRAEDIKISEDLIEEVARIYGYHNLPTNLPPLPEKLGTEEKVFYWERRVRGALKGIGFSETCTSSFTSEEILEQAGVNPENTLKLKNPLTTELTNLRTSLLPQMLEIVSQNQAHRREQRLFQLSRVFLSQKGGELPQEPQRLVGMVFGTDITPFYQAKSAVETALTELGVKDISFSPLTETFGEGIAECWQPGCAAKICAGAEELGVVGEIRPDTLANFSITEPVAAFSLYLDTATRLATTARTYQPIPKHPAIVEDLTFEVGEQTLAGEMANNIADQGTKSETIKIYAEISGIYQDPNLEKQRKKTVTFRITYQPIGKGLSDKEITPLRKQIIEEIERSFGAHLRGKGATASE